MELSEVSRKVVNALVPSVVTSFAGFLCVRVFKICTDQTHKIFGKLLYNFFLPILSFGLAFRFDPLHLNLKLVAADFIAKFIILPFLALWARFHPNASFRWSITCSSLTFLSSPLLVGVPLADAAFGPMGVDVALQNSFIQATIWQPMLQGALVLQNRFRSSCDAATASSSDGNVHPIGEAEENNLEAGTSVVIVVSNNNNNVPLLMVIKKVFLNLITDPNIYATFIALVCASVATRYKIQMPTLVEKCVTFFTGPATFLAMFNMGIFFGLQKNLIACGVKQALLGFVLKFIVGPAAMAIASLSVGLHGDVLRAAILQAATPQSLTSFIYANEYELHPEVFSTSVFVGTTAFLPVSIAFVALLRSFG